MNHLIKSNNNDNDNDNEYHNTTLAKTIRLT